MKRHSTWLAAGLLLFAVIACNLTKNSNSNNNSKNSNTNKNTNAPTVNRPANAEIYVTSLTVGKEDNGKATTTIFAPEDHTVYANVTLNKPKSGTQVRFVWIAADVAGATNEELKPLDYTTRAFEKFVYGHLTWPKDWLKGKYRVDVYINGNLDKTVDYRVE
jgi:hypothetical protein